MGAALFFIFLFNFYGAHREPPFIQIGEIKPIMNFSTVRVRGVLSSDPRKLQNDESLYIVDDGSGELPVFLIQSAGVKFPKAGSRVVVEGRLRLGADQAFRMRVQSSEQIVVIPFIPMKEKVGTSGLAEITADRKGEYVTVYGQVSKVWSPRSGSKAPHKIVLTDPSGSLDVIHWFEPESMVALGDILKVRGTIDVYKTHPQLKVWKAEHIRLFSE